MSALGLTTTLLATGLSQAVAKDVAGARGRRETFDISAGTFGPNVSSWLREVAAAFVGGVACAPIPMVLHCPACGVQHVDAPEGPLVVEGRAVTPTLWTNPPHRSHLCAGCGFVWRPADVPTVGVAAITTRGKNDGDLAAMRAELKRLGG